MNPKRVVMKDIAEQAGVHQTTVSLALRNDPRIALKTRERIQRIAKELGYVPDPVLHSLVAYRKNSQIQRSTETLALIFDVPSEVQFEESEYLPSIREEVIRRASELGYRVEVLIKGQDFNSGRMLDRILTARGVHGILFGAMFEVQWDFEWDPSAFSMVKIGLEPAGLEIDCVMGNYFFSVRKILRTLKAAGYQRPAMAGSLLDEHNTRNAYAAGFLYGQWKHFEPEQHIPYYEFERRPNAEVIEEIYQWLRRVKPDVFMSYWNNLHLPVIRLNREDGIRCRFVCVEGDVQTIRFGGLRNNYRKMARSAVELLISKMRMFDRGIPDSPTLTLVDSKWHELCDWDAMLKSESVVGG